LFEALGLLERVLLSLKMKDVKENSVQWTDWDSHRECLNFNKVGKHSSSTKIITVYSYTS